MHLRSNGPIPDPAPAAPSIPAWQANEATIPAYRGEYPHAAPLNPIAPRSDAEMEEAEEVQEELVNEEEESQNSLVADAIEMAKIWDGRSTTPSAEFARFVAHDGAVVMECKKCASTGGHSIKIKTWPANEAGQIAIQQHFKEDKKKNEPDRELEEYQMNEEAALRSIDEDNRKRKGRKVEADCELVEYDGNWYYTCNLCSDFNYIYTEYWKIGPEPLQKLFRHTEAASHKN